MSSKVRRKGDSGFGAAETWQPRGAGLSDPIEPRCSEFSCLEYPASAAEHDIRIKAAIQQGRDEAEAAAEQRATQKAEPAIAGLNRILEELTGGRKRFREEVERETVKLAIAVARRVLHRELSTDPTAIFGMVAAALQELDACEIPRLRVSPSDAALIEENRPRLDLPFALEISPDPSLDPGCVIFETSHGELDASMDTQLSEIDRGLDALAKSSAS
jgi:flagellar assembly protein FliH